MQSCTHAGISYYYFKLVCYTAITNFLVRKLTDYKSGHHHAQVGGGERVTVFGTSPT
jgi:hypothetical protein